MNLLQSIFDESHDLRRIWYVFLCKRCERVDVRLAVDFQVGQRRPIFPANHLQIFLHGWTSTSTSTRQDRVVERRVLTVVSWLNSRTFYSAIEWHGDSSATFSSKWSAQSDFVNLRNTCAHQTWIGIFDWPIPRKSKRLDQSRILFHWSTTFSVVARPWGSLSQNHHKNKFNNIPLKYVY